MSRNEKNTNTQTEDQNPDLDTKMSHGESSNSIIDLLEDDLMWCNVR